MGHFPYIFQYHNECLPDHHTVSVSEYIDQGDAEKEIDRPSHPGSLIKIACLQCLQLFCTDCLDAMGGWGEGEICVNEMFLTQ